MTKTISQGEAERLSTDKALEELLCLLEGRHNEKLIATDSERHADKARGAIQAIREIRETLKSLATGPKPQRRASTAP